MPRSVTLEMCLQWDVDVLAHLHITTHTVLLLLTSKQISHQETLSKLAAHGEVEGTLGLFAISSMSLSEK